MYHEITINERNPRGKTTDFTIRIGNKVLCPSWKIFLLFLFCNMKWKWSNIEGWRVWQYFFSSCQSKKLTWFLIKMTNLASLLQIKTKGLKDLCQLTWIPKSTCGHFFFFFFWIFLHSSCWEVNTKNEQQFLFVP